jgi:gluconate 2-dehydrogenase gamma chain
MTNKPLSRRAFLKGTGAIALTGVAAASAACSSAVPETEELPAVLRDTRTPAAKFNAAQGPFAEPPDPTRLLVFTVHEALTVEALTARILPGSPDDPGAREAGVVTYIDNLLARNEGFAEPTYRQPPYAQVYRGDTPPQTTFNTIGVPADLIKRYGFQAILTPREVYRSGLEAVDRYANALFTSDFVDLNEDNQDTIIGDMAEGKATGFGQVSAEQFFQVLRRHTAEGMFSDPIYGGNRNLFGWQLIGYPGAHRAWTASEIQTEGVRRDPQSHLHLEPFNPGQFAREGAVMPLSGSDPNSWNDAHRELGE